jgi:hypothetical protein
MAVDLEVFLERLEERLETIPGFNVTFEPASTGTPPFGWVGLPPIPDYQMTFARARVEIRPTITVLVSKAQSRDGTLALARFANPTGEQSISACIDADKTIGGTCETCFVESFRPLGEEEAGVLSYWGGQFTLFAVARGN